LIWSTPVVAVKYLRNTEVMLLMREMYFNIS
jgi:hypothetical protein